MSVIKDVRWAGANTTISVLELIRERGLESKRIGLVGSIPFQVYGKIAEQFRGAAFSDLSGKLRMMRTIRSAEEIERIRFASKLTEDRLRHWPTDLSRNARGRDCRAHRASLPQERRLRRYSLYEQHADARSGFPGTGAVPVQSQAAKRRLPDYRNQRRLFRLQRADSPDVFDRRGAHPGMAKDARRGRRSLRSSCRGDQGRRHHHRSRRSRGDHSPARLQHL